jgi:ribosome maturation protein Sdo1
MECSIYQNYSASEVFVQGMAGVVNQQDVEAMIRAQKKMLQRFEKTNEMLSNCNVLSATRLERAMRDFKAHTAYIQSVKADLDSVLKRISVIKSKLGIPEEKADSDDD